MKRHLFWIAELFIWILILTLISGGLMLAKYNYQKRINTYQIFLPDVDGLINGSPVRIMGIQVGYVNQIDIVDGSVYVKFVVTDSNVKVPKSTIATVEFSGLGGSKSLELYPPQPDRYKSNLLIVPQAPKRIHDSLGLLNDMFNQAIGLTYDVSHFMDQLGMLKRENMDENNDSKSVNEIIDISNNWIDKLQNKSNNFSNKLNNIKKRNRCKNGCKDGNE